MSGPDVDLSQIRGDWAFHMNYLVNAIDRTLERELRLWDQLAADASGIDEVVRQQASIWHELTAKVNHEGLIPVADSLVQDFIDTSATTKSQCDSFEEANGLSGSLYHTDTPAEQFTEACRQVRSLCEDLVMMRDQAP